MAWRQFDSRPGSRLVWAEVLRVHDRDLDRSERLLASVVDESPGGYPFDEVVLAKQRGRIDRLEQIALDERYPFPARSTPRARWRSGEQRRRQSGRCGALGANAREMLPRTSG